MDKSSLRVISFHVIWMILFHGSYFLRVTAFNVARGNPRLYASSSEPFLIQRRNYHHRGCILDSSTSGANDIVIDRYRLAQDLIVGMASKKTWKRFSGVYELATRDSDSSCTCVDVGCDHGLLTIAFAMGGCFKRVVGIDISERALHDGALANLDKIMSLSDKLPTSVSASFPSNLDFEVGDGIKNLKEKEACTVCICGVGVNTMDDILFSGEQAEESFRFKRLVLQPTNSRPRNLITLYDKIQNKGYVVLDEHMVYLSKRFYITTSFIERPYDQQNKSKNVLPGEIIMKNSNKESDNYKTWKSFVSFHLDWLEREKKLNPHQINQSDQRWLNFFGKL